MISSAWSAVFVLRLVFWLVLRVHKALKGIFLVLKNMGGTEATLVLIV